MKTGHDHHIPDDAWEASVSAWVDGEAEMRAEELDTPYGRQVWDTYHLIGDVLRSQDLAIRPSDRFYARLSAALDAEPAVLAPTGLRGRRGIVRMGLSGLAVAAAAATVAWVASPFFQGVQAPEPAVLVQAETPAPLSADQGLDEYMMAHQAIAGSGPVRQASFDAAGPR